MTGHKNIYTIFGKYGLVPPFKIVKNGGLGNSSFMFHYDLTKSLSWRKESGTCVRSSFPSRPLTGPVIYMSVR